MAIAATPIVNIMTANNGLKDKQLNVCQFLFSTHVHGAIKAEAIVLEPSESYL
jgi:hypothetical protein